MKGFRNYRPIGLLSALYKIFAKVIRNRMRATLEFNKPREHAVFRKGYSIIDNFFFK